MRHVLVVRTVNPAMLEIRTGENSAAESISSPRRDSEAIPEPFDLVLAGLGGCTTNAIADHAISNGWHLDAIHVDLALFGEAPWQAIGRRIWVDGDVDSSQLASLLGAAEQSPVAVALRPTVYIQSRIARVASPTTPPGDEFKDADEDERRDMN